jgi:hypothetical protein
MHQIEAWPELPWSEWASTCEALHRWTQIAGKAKLALTPMVNHWWNVTLDVTPSGLSTGLMPYGSDAFEMTFDFLSHRLVVARSDGRSECISLRPMSVAGFYAETMAALERLGIEVHIWTMPSEIENGLPLDRDEVQRGYDPLWVARFMQVLRQVYRIFCDFRARFIGKASPVGFFWGSFDLAVTRFSGRTAPLLHSNTPNVAEWVMQEAYSHEVSSCGFWPGNGGYGRAAFFSYAYPQPQGFAERAIDAAGAFYDRDLGMFVLPYDDLRKARDCDRLLLTFLQETYEAAADLSHWDRSALERRP